MTTPASIGPASERPPHPPKRRAWRATAIGLTFVVLGGLAAAAPFVAGPSAPFALGVLLLASGLLDLARAYASRGPSLRSAAFLSSAMDAASGLLLLAAPNLAVGALALLLGASFVVDGFGKALAAARSRAEPGSGALASDGLINLILGFIIAAQWPVSAVVPIGLSVGFRILSSGWAIIIGRAAVREGAEAKADAEAKAAVPAEAAAAAARLHPDARLRLPSHAEVAKMREALAAEDGARGAADRYWKATFLVTFFAIHVGRMEAEWNLVGFLSPAIAVAGDIVFALLLAWAVVVPVRLGFRSLSRPLERLAWRRRLRLVDRGGEAGLADRALRPWLARRLRLSVRLAESRGSPTAALGFGLQVGLPLAAVLIALNPIWGFSWYFNTENWATGLGERWAEVRVDAWREHMVRAVLGLRTGDGGDGATLFRVEPEGVAESADWSFLVIGDPGEGDASQHVLRDRYLALGERADMRFLVVSSDVIYPSGAMRHYETKFYLPFKGWTKPIYAIPGNHDWYDALDAFSANFLEPEAARAALRARREADRGLTSTTEAKIERLVDEAARLRRVYAVRAAGQRAPFFEVQAARFALIAVDTGILRRVDEEQMRWLRGALERARGKLTMAILGHPLYAGGRYQGGENEDFAALHALLRAHEVDIVMGGDTHYLEYYRETHPARGGKAHTVHHFVNGGGGAYLSIGTPLDWPAEAALEDCAFYPRADALVAKLDEQTPLWKRPAWFWLKRFGGWPASSEALAGAFDFNRAPFFQSFVEVRVEGSAGRVRLIPHGVNGPLAWRDFELFGEAVPAGRSPDDPAELAIPLPGGP